MRDTSSLARAAKGVGSAFYCVPQSGESSDVAAYYRSFAEPAAAAFADAKVARVVTISGGRGDPSDVGPSGPLAAMERSFDATGAATRHVRCGYFMENFLYMIPQLKFTGSFSLPVAGTTALSLESAQDIGRTAARWILDSTWHNQEGVSVPYGELMSCDDAAVILSRALGKRIVYKAITGEAYKANLVKYGVSSAMGQALKEMFDDMEHGSIGSANGPKDKDSLSFATWAQTALKPQMTWWRVLRRVAA